MKTAEELWGLLNQAEDLPYGAAQIALVEQVLRHVDGAGDPALAFYTRLFATTAYMYGGEPVKSFPTFSWCVADFDRKPAPYHERWTHNLLWLFKNMVNALTRFPEVPLARTYVVLDDMERRYREHGRGLQAVYKHRYLVAQHIGATEEAQGWFEKWQAAPRDELSDCAGCDPTSLAYHLIGKEQFAEAVELAEPVLAGHLSCSEQPQSILSELMVAYLRSGRPAEAADAHRRSYLIERNNLADFGGIGDHISFCARSGNEHRGLEILQRHIDWFDRAPSPSSAMWFAAESSMLLRRITELGHGDVVIRRSGKPDITAAELSAELAAFATETAARFDARNGTDHQGESVRKALIAEPYEFAVQLSATARPTPVGPVAAPPRPAEVVPEPPAEIPAGSSIAELLDLAEHYRSEDRDAAFREVMTAVEAEVEAQLKAQGNATGDVPSYVPGNAPGGVVLEPALAARLFKARGFVLADGQHEETVDAWSRAAELFAEAGEEGEASLMRARAALVRSLADEPTDELLAVITATVAHHEEHGNPDSRASAWLRLSQMYRLLGRLDDANEAGDNADRFAGETGDARRSAFHAIVRAQNRALAHRHEEAAAAARLAFAFYQENGPADSGTEAAVLLGQLTESPEEAVAVLTPALATDLGGAAVPARIHRARALVSLDRPAEAIEDYVEVIGLTAEQGGTIDDPELMDHTGIFARHELAQAYQTAGRTAEAIEVAEEALLGFERFGIEEPAVNCRFLLANLYRDLGDNTRALDGFRDLIERLVDNPAGRGQIGEQAGQLLYDLDRDSEAALTFRAAAESLRESGDPVGELRVLRRRLMALNYADQVAEAEELIGEVAERHNALPAELAAEPVVIWGRGVFAFEVGNLLMRRGRFDEAVPHLRGAPERLREIGATDDADRVTSMLAEALLRSGSVDEAETMLDTLLAGMDPDAASRELTVTLLDEAREAKKGLNDR
ncbi:tetratricopeptide (TPR) repeat protein [Actinoplanes lutulentus]|uniref:Cytochrome c-type biogenesis protein CcmH/NrfG n=1 Tax=Actinoplanes lutulentus TaxID=1287878 RepID=A0A327ZGZ3_9ACTN|nr:tetratricopeptide repeat protein [Actinoplanes lutulentus]MBB2944826.1 tetratricopeptide (TPR) repeat protein [Actinoplanes lutulentus]RAK35381.1 cytochrome c-type biogenesis protein CcmH/NrfG [Actinoplanes lutulentus]